MRQLLTILVFCTGIAAAELSETGFQTNDCDAADVPWLSDVQQAPAQPVAINVGIVRPLLVDDDSHSIQTATEWAAQRTRLKSKWTAFLGRMPKAPDNNEIKILRDDSLPDCSRRLIEYECEPGLLVQAYLLRSTDPKFSGRRPGLVALHQTTKNTIDEIAGLAGSESLQLGLKLARRGFIVICPRCFLWQDVNSLQEAVSKFQSRHPKALGMKKMLYDASRAVDILVHQPDVDTDRICAVGHSLGAKEVLYLTAFDERIRAAVASEGGLTLKSTNWDARWYLGPKVHDADFERNHHELLALAAPRALLILGGESGPGAADGDRSWPLIEAALPVYRLFDTAPKLGLLNHHQGHSISDASFERIAEWLRTYCGRLARQE